ncbi:MAG: site-specific DNA-methyltransferase [Cetobacterium sp.]
MEKLKGASMDIVGDNIEKLKSIFPEIFSENKIDFNALKAILGEQIDTENERYSFNWHGKSKARKIAQESSTGTLLPSKDESKNWNNTDNLYIEGDNLEVLKLLQKSYHNKVKMIYIDPPYNTGKDFVYPDNFKDNLKNYLEITGQVGEEGQKLSTNSDSSGRYHSDWLNMMYPRLKIARNLLADDGVIFVSIDDNEQSNLQKICDEIFGEENFIKLLPTVMNLKGNNDEFGFAGTHEYTLVYVKNKNILEDLGGIRLDESDIKEYNLKDEKGFYKKGATLMRTGEDGVRERRPKGYYPIYVNVNSFKMYVERQNNTDIEIFPKTKDGIEMSWRRSKETLAETIDEFIIVNSTNGISFYKKQRLEEIISKGKKAKSLFYKPEYSSGNGTTLIKTLFSNKVFNNPKPLDLIKDFITIGLNTIDSIILDFFSGSATTAHATMQLNAEDGGNRKYIMLQLPEPTPDNSEASKAGYKNICEIGKERIRRAGEKIKADESLPLENREKLDVGFKVFKLDTSNIKEWDSETDNLEQSLFDSIDNIKTDRTSLDVLYEILLKYGLDLNVPIVENKDFYSIGGGTLLINLDTRISLDVIDSMCEEYKNLLEVDEDYKTTVVLRDSSFQSDADKTNAIQRLKQAGIKEIRSI